MRLLSVKRPIQRPPRVKIILTKMSRNQPISDSEDSDAPFLPSEIVSDIIKEIEGDDDLNQICETVSFLRA